MDHPVKKINRPLPPDFKFERPGFGDITESIFLAGNFQPKAVTAKVDVEEHEIWSRTDIGVREKKTLVMSRRGQGLFRTRLAKVEPACRVTSSTSATHLRASHIKPWESSNDQEKLDGNNG